MEKINKMAETRENFRCAVVGCGGIGSYLAQHLDRLIELRQIKGDFIFFDDDTVEVKNILYQNFEPGDVDSKKTAALAFRYLNLYFEDRRVELKDFEKRGPDLIVLCADNDIIRHDALAAKETHEIEFIDARANGKAIGLYSSATEDYYKTISKSKESHSCQNPFQLSKKEIEYGNVIVASMTAQAILTYTRTRKLPNDLILSF